MPNWNYNDIVLYGSKETMKPICDKVDDIRKDGLLKTLLPMPSELNETSSPTRIVSQEERDEQIKVRDEWDNSPLPIQERTPKYRPMVNITREISEDFRRKFNYDNWYDWSIWNWGTKWNDSPIGYEDKYDVSVSIGEDESQLRIHCMTPWCEPSNACLLYTSDAADE